VGISTAKKSPLRRAQALLLSRHAAENVSATHGSASNANIQAHIKATESEIGVLLIQLILTAHEKVPLEKRAILYSLGEFGAGA
jgi:hypothetical protein